MTYDRPATRQDYRATAVDTRPALTAQLDALSESWPNLQPVLHKGFGTYGVVRDDSPANVPFLFDGKPRRVSIGFEGETWVSVTWNPGGAVPLRCWTRADYLTTCGRRF
ncbi:hypothetical protein ACIP4S_13355 [Streptomyces chartreusis]|uniref:hypothetical protein n=1 Tax=Streptomyces chartreusis TaxID=1969 RepID=UPI0038127CCA